MLVDAIIISTKELNERGIFLKKNFSENKIFNLK
jgi:hypothetical protein